MLTPSLALSPEPFVTAARAVRHDFAAPDTRLANDLGRGRPAGHGITFLGIDSSSSGDGLHPARKYQPSTGAVKGSRILWPLPSARTYTARVLNLCGAKASWKSCGPGP
jgi:hypothetical protein